MPGKKRPADESHQLKGESSSKKPLHDDDNIPAALLRQLEINASSPRNLELTEKISKSNYGHIIKWLEEEKPKPYSISLKGMNLSDAELSTFLAAFNKLDCKQSALNLSSVCIGSMAAKQLALLKSSQKIKAFNLTDCKFEEDGLRKFTAIFKANKLSIFLNLSNCSVVNTNSPALENTDDAMDDKILESLASSGLSQVHVNFTSLLPVSKVEYFLLQLNEKIKSYKNTSISFLLATNNSATVKLEIMLVDKQYVIKIKSVNMSNFIQDIIDSITKNLNAIKDSIHKFTQQLKQNYFEISYLHIDKKFAELIVEIAENGASAPLTFVGCGFKKEGLETLVSELYRSKLPPDFNLKLQNQVVSNNFLQSLADSLKFYQINITIDVNRSSSITEQAVANLCSSLSESPKSTIHFITPESVTIGTPSRIPQNQMLLLGYNQGRQLRCLENLLRRVNQTSSSEDRKNMQRILSR